MKERLILSIVILITYFSFFNKFTHTFHFNSDKCAQLQATQNFINGKSITVDDISLSDLSKSNNSPLIGWPPGYTMLLVPINVFTHDLIKSTVVLNYIFLFVYLILCMLILQLLEIKLPYILLFFAFTAITNQPVLTLTSTDLISLVFFLSSIYLMLLLIKKDNASIVYYILLGILISISVIVKYNFLIIALFVPAFLIIINYFKKDKKQLTNSIITICTTGIVLILLFLYQKSLTGHYTYLTAYEQGTRYYFENLTKSSPFIFETFFVRDLSKLTNSSLIKSIPIISSIILIIGLFILFCYVSYITIKTQFNNLNLTRLFFLLGSCIIFLNVAMLVYLSIKYPPQNPGFTNWTYVEELRYFAPASFFIIFFLFILISDKAVNNFIQKTFMGILVVSLLFGVLIKTQKVRLYGKEAFFDFDKLNLSSSNDPYVKTYEKVKEIKLKSPEFNIVYGDVSSNQRLMALAGAGILWNFENILKTNKLYSSHPTILLISGNKNNASINSFIKKYNGKAIYLSDNNSLYEFIIKNE